MTLHQGEKSLVFTFNSAQNINCHKSEINNDQKLVFFYGFLDSGTPERGG